MRAVITVLGKDMVGILAKVSSICQDNNINITEVTQSIMQDLFAMIMLVDMTKSKVSCAELTDKMNNMGNGLGLTIHVMHEDIFNTMHKI